MVDAATLYVAPLAKRSASALLCSDTEDALAKMRDEDNDWVFGWAPQLFSISLPCTSWQGLASAWCNQRNAQRPITVS